MLHVSKNYELHKWAKLKVAKLLNKLMQMDKDIITYKFIQIQLT